LFSPEPSIRDGVFDVPTRPGLGMELNTEVLDRLRIA
jgi:L-alanine-DL-glutamate epimerase-like enolase superfamily enzyme